MKFLLMSFRIFKDYAFLSLLLCAEMVFVLLTISMTINNQNYTAAQTSLIESNGLSNSLYFFGRGSVPVETVVNGEIQFELIEDTSYRDDMFSYLKSIPEYIGTSKHDTAIVNTGSSEIYISSFDNITSEKLKLKTVKGVWYTEAEHYNDTIPCVVMDTNTIPDKYNIGDIIEGEAYSNEKENKVHLKFEVVGIVDKMNSMVLSDGSTWFSGPVPSIDAIFSRVKVSTETILCGNLPESLKKEQLTGIIYLDSNLSAEKLDEIYNDFDKYGSTYKISDMCDRAKEINREEMTSMIPVIIILIISVFVGIICISLLNAKKQMKVFAIYNLCGSNWIKNFLIYLVYLLILLAVSFLVFSAIMIYMYLADKNGSFYLYHFSNETIIISIASCLLTSIISATIPFINILSKSSVDNYKNI